MNPERQKQLDEAWLDSMLQSAYRVDSAAEKARIAGVMERLDEPQRRESKHSESRLSEPLRARPTWGPTRSPWFSARHLSALAIAASLLILAVFVVDTSDRRAYAAIARSAQAVSKLRHYKVQMTFQRAQLGERELAANLYIDPSNRYVIEHPGFFGRGTTWLGGDGSQRWLVPPRGPAFVGRPQLLDRWLTSQDSTSPYLHLSTILESMSKAYQLSMLPDERIQTDDGRALACSHVHGQLKATRVNLPISIDLWADAQSGIAQRIELKWAVSPDRRGPVQLTLELSGSAPSLGDDWFDLRRHAGSRRIVQVKSENELQQAE